MTTVWDGYRVIELPFGPVQPRQLTRRQARQFFDAMMGMREARIDELRGLVSRNGYRVDTELEFRAGVVDFINGHAELDDTPIDIGYEVGDDADMFRPLLAIWQAVALDVGLFLGSAIVAEVPTVRWELLVKGGTLMDGYHFPVLKGFEHGPWPDYYISPLTLTQQVVGAAAGAGERVPMRPFEYWIAWAREVA